MKWITPRNINVDWVARPWLIHRFLDPAPKFFFVDQGQLLESRSKG
jgi:hypothetical protein